MVSVVMLTYKRANILPQAIDSILAQDYKDFEFIILNDGSPDNTKQVVAAYNDPRIRYYENPENKGIAFSRNRAASLARGKYVMIMDDDDQSLPERVKKQVAYMENHPEIDVLAGQIKGLPRIPENHDKIAIGLIQNNNFGNANVIYRRKTAQKYHIRYNEMLKVCEDWDFWLSLLFSGAKFASMPDDVLVRNAISQKHYGASYEHGDKQVRKRIGAFFAPAAPETFYNAGPCQKIRLMMRKHIVSQLFLQGLISINCS